MTEKKAQELAQMQQQMLDVVCAYVKPGGTMVYSTCTIHRAENEENVETFLQKHADFSLVSQKQMYPGEVGSDGFFLAKMVRSMHG